MTKNFGVEKIEVINYDENSQIVTKEYQYTYNKTNIDEYKEYFCELIDKGKICNCKYDDEIWFIKIKNSTRKIKIDIDIYGQLNNMLKIYTLLLFKQNLSGGTIIDATKRLKELIVLSNGFEAAEIEEFKCEYEVMIHHYKVIMKTHGVRFAAFSQYGDYEEYIQFFRGVSVPYMNYVRKIASYDSIIFFDEVLENYINNCSSEEKRNYFPILLWWKITKRIPMRSYEFLSLVFDCVYVDKNAHYWLHVPRIKRKAQPGRIGVVNELRIDRDTYQLICNYKEMIKDKYKTQHLISYKSYFSFMDNSHKALALKLKNNLEQTELAQFIRLLDSFYDKVVDTIALEHGYTDIQRLRPGDTRHLAFINMKLQGFSRLTIARIGGHTNLNSQMSYYKRENIYAKSRVKVLSNIFIMKKRLNYGEGFLCSFNELIEKSKVYYGDELAEGRPIKKGWCNDNEFPYNCYKVRDCEWCNSYFLNLKKYPDAVKDLKKLSDGMDKELDIQIETLNRIFDEMNIQIDSETYSYNEQEDLSTVSKQIHDTILQKAKLDAWIKEVNDSGK